MVGIEENFNTKQKHKQNRQRGLLTLARSSDPLLISAETLLSSRAKVTFFSSLGSDIWRTMEDTESECSEKVVSLRSDSDSAWCTLRRFSDSWISSPRLTCCGWWEGVVRRGFFELSDLGPYLGGCVGRWRYQLLQYLLLLVDVLLGGRGVVSLLAG